MNKKKYISLANKAANIQINELKKIKKVLAICWGMQVAVTAAGGEVKKGEKGSHRGIARDIEINENGLNHPLYKNKNKKDSRVILNGSDKSIFNTKGKKNKKKIKN